ncbi:multidrug efflux SMR transporter [Helicobacter sp. MIT 11-5569]|uniref:DMT family transporter n=1 Tax=Helicobacter sp. MIT 11-5569 TaxID=1548151 RepID=UPI00051FB1CE|nr:multidrug efflux SMR transporter [Helicobacter sp. MIT 11-5569]TLD82908.1 multidrug efflux SMR transporter [Helicobacter sp. MIT 11-5569]
MAWLLILFGGIVEVFWVSGLKYSTTFVGYFFTILGILTSFTCMILAIKRVEVSIAYAVFVGIGAVGVILSEIFIFGAKVSLVQSVLIAVLLISIVGLKLVSKESDAKDSKTIEEISEILGIDALDDQIESGRNPK